MSSSESSSSADLGAGYYCIGGFDGPGDPCNNPTDRISEIYGCFYFPETPVQGSCTSAGYYVNEVHYGPFSDQESCTTVCAGSSSSSSASLSSSSSIPSYECTGYRVWLASNSCPDGWYLTGEIYTESGANPYAEGWNFYQEEPDYCHAIYSTTLYTDIGIYEDCYTALLFAGTWDNPSFDGLQACDCS